MIQLVTITNFDIEQIANSGQCFRMNPHPTEPNTYTVIAYGRYLKIRQQPGSDIVELDCSESDFKEIWQKYFDLDTNYQHFIDQIDPTDTYLVAAVGDGAGIRILRQELWETMVSFIISQNNNIPRIKNTIEKLCVGCGIKHTAADGTLYHQFPTPEALAKPENLEGMGLGYRDKYVLKLAENILTGTIDLQQFYHNAQAEEYTEKYFKGIYGIGLKVANCIQLYGLHQISVFPVDTWIKKIINEQYAGKFPLELYEGFAGIIQQYIFNYAVHRGSVKK